ncbi:class I SAM-dependent methyltransferase [Desulfosporosinus sp. SYSU MS00001]|uniref:class I SAM-dependent methyltransferase n=1 Tax=Desulfosporosinus sp. SYSU MS00001 TaxID=3416284 RepID=UPI003CED0C5B
MRLDWHEDFIVHLASVIRPQVYIELGLFKCTLFNRMIPYAGQLIGVDINPKAGSYMQASANTRFFNGSTQEFAKELEKNSLQINMLFIDADHSKEAVLNDFWDYFPHVAPHGLILFHDTHPGEEYLIQPEWCGTAYKAIEELLKETGPYELMTIPVSPGLTICRKRQAQLSWKES